MRRYLLLLAGSVGVGTSAAILSGYVIVGRGDPSARVIRSFLAENDLGAFASDWINWSGTWPAGYFLIQGAWMRLLGALGVESMLHLTQGGCGCRRSPGRSFSSPRMAWCRGP